MTFDLVQFACFKADQPKYLVLTEKQFDSYVTGEPPEGYAVFKYLGEVELTEETLKEVIKNHEKLS